ncbi:MAG: Ni/Fe hydrogenase subunit beta [Planctomycetes bacterium]|nr:Ni/Fe hydrogenase subunit beta [Planctomycetota bacterium]
MTVKKLKKAAFDKWVEACIKKQQVYGVQAKEDRFVFAPLANAEDLRLDYDVTILPPKKYFQPPRETLLKFDRKAGFESLSDSQPFVLFGVHPYDMVAISQMDKLFATDNCDTQYVNRRQKATIVACDVQNASDEVFAGCMDTATVKDGFDILITKIESDYLVDIRSEKGQALAETIKSAKDADDMSLKLRELVWADNTKLLQKHKLNVRHDVLPKLLERSYEHPVWEEKAERCYSCGSCNLVCPTCYCFDVQDDVEWDLQKGERVRVWDGCLLAEFANVAGGHNFRKNRADRYRHRFYRKGQYVPEKIGEVACVGCGRCIKACTAKIANPVEIYNKLVDEGK